MAMIARHGKAEGPYAISAFLQKPFNWFIVSAAVVIGCMTAFVVFQPVKVVPRIAYGPTFSLNDMYGEPFSTSNLQNRIVLYGFGYTSDPTGRIEQTTRDMSRLHQALAASHGADVSIVTVLILFDAQRDTPSQLQLFARQYGITGQEWRVLGGNEQALKEAVGLGFGLYYEAVPLSELPRATNIATYDEEAYGFLYAERYFLADGRNMIRAEYRPPLDVEIALRDIGLIVREQNSRGAAQIVNEAAHLFMCYPS